MKLKFSSSKWILLVGLGLFQYSNLFGQFDLSPITLPETFYLSYDLPYLYVGGNDNAISIREQYDFKFSFSRNINAPKNNENNVFPFSISSYYDTRWRGDLSKFTLGYSPLPHLYVKANLFLTKEGDTYGRHNSKMLLGDFGMGVYHLKKSKGIPFLKKKLDKVSGYMMSNKGLLMNALVGYSRGSIIHTSQYRLGKGEFLINQFYGKIGLDYQAGFLGIASDLKFGVLNYGKTIIKGHAYEELSAQRALLINENDFLFGELSFRIYVGMKYGQIYINGITTKVNNKMSEFVLSGFWNVGVVLDIQDVFKKKGKNEK